MIGPYVVGIDVSSRAIDLVRLNENHDEAEWLSVPLTGHAAWDRVRLIADRMPPAGWWADVYLCAIERPFARARQDVVRLAQGAALACIPTRVETWEVTPATWKQHLGLKQTEKPSWSAFPSSFFDEYWDQNARDALGVALYARDVNAAGIAAALNPQPPERNAA